MSAQYVVLEEWRGRAAEAIGDALGGSCMRQAGACSDDPEFCGCQRAAAATLAAVLPLAVAQERERCAKVADERFELHKAGAVKVSHTKPLNAVMLFNHQCKYAEAEHIAAAIRQEPGHE